LRDENDDRMRGTSAQKAGASYSGKNSIRGGQVDRGSVGRGDQYSW